MLAKVIPNHRHKHGRQKDFAARVRYPFLTADAVELVNLAGSCWQDAAFQMRTTAGLAPFLLNPDCHIVLTWGEGERPTDRQIFDAGRSAVEELGGSEFQYVMAIHKNRVNIHLHILCNRVHPLTGQVLSTSHDYARLELACRKIEHLNGWPQDRGRFDCAIMAEKVSLVPKPAEHWKRKTEERKLGLRPDGRAVRRQEHRTGFPPLRDLLSPTKIDQLRSAIDAATSWKDVHQCLQVEDLQYIDYGNGARILWTKGPLFMAAGQMGTSCTANNLQKRLGEFVPADTITEKTEKHGEVAAETTAKKTRLMNLSPIEEAMHFVKVAVSDIRRWRRDRADARKALRAAQKIETLQVRDLLQGRRTSAAKALRRVMKAMHREQRAELRSKHPAPHSEPFDATTHISRLAPQELNRRRYRHVHRMEGLNHGVEWDGIPRDHTACRQAWYIAQPRGVAQIPKRIQEIIFGHRADVRIDHLENLLFARRNSVGSIVGFAVRQAKDLLNDVDQPIGSGDGLCLIGSQSATEFTVVPDVISGLIAATEKMTEHKLIVVEEAGMTPRTQHFLRALRSSRTEAVNEQTFMTPSEAMQDAPKNLGDVPDKVVIDGGPDEGCLEDESHNVPTSSSPTPF